jgi:MYXO-CTERM domain-containing protein
MAVLHVTQPLEPGDDPQVAPLIANYSLYVDGQLLGTTPSNDLNSEQATCCKLEFLDHEHGIGGSEFGASNAYFRGQIALTRLSLGALNIEQSLFRLPAVPNSGDYNGDGFIDAADYCVWRKSVGASVNPGTGADGNGNGTIDSPDYAHWRNRYGTLVGSEGLVGDSPQIPEPACGAIAIIGLAALFARRRRVQTTWFTRCNPFAANGLRPCDRSTRSFAESGPKPLSRGHIRCPMD